MSFLASPRTTNAAVLILMAAAAFILYGNTLSNRFVFDDISLVLENRAIRDPGGIADILGLETGRPLYRPVRHLSYLADYALSGLNPAAYHVSNIAYHALTAWMLYLLLELLGGSAAAALIGALLFAAHPVHTDSVAYISGRRDILTGLFFLTGFYWFVRTCRGGGAGAILLTGLFYLLALGAKEMAVTLPAVCLAYDWAFGAGNEGKGGRKAALRRRLAAYGVLFAPGAAYLYYKMVLHYPSLRTEYYGGSALSNFATMFRVLSRYIQVTLFPVVLNADYSYNAFPISETFFEGRVLAAAGLAAALLVLIFRARRQSRLVFLGGVWFFVTLLPVCQIFPHHELLAEHYLYIPSAGAALMLTPLWETLLRERKKACLVCVAALLIVFSVRTLVRNRDWRDSEHLWAGVLEAAPECARAHDNLGNFHFQQGDYRQAKRHHRQAVSLRPDHGIFHNNLGMDYGALGDLAAAEQEFRQALTLNPRLAAARNNLGLIYYKKGMYAEAARWFWESAGQKPDARAWLNAGRACLKLNEPEWARKALERALALRGRTPAAHYFMGLAWQQSGQSRQAAGSFLQAVSLREDYADAWLSLGRVYLYELDDASRAVQYLEKCVRLQPEMKAARRLLAQAKQQQKEGLR